MILTLHWSGTALTLFAVYNQRRSTYRDNGLPPPLGRPFHRSRLLRALLPLFSSPVCISCGISCTISGNIESYIYTMEHDKTINSIDASLNIQENTYILLTLHCPSAARASHNSSLSSQSDKWLSTWHKSQVHSQLIRLHLQVL